MAGPKSKTSQARKAASKDDADTAAGPKRTATDAKDKSVKDGADDLDQTSDVLGDTRAVKQPALRSGTIMSDATDPDRPLPDPDHPLDQPEIDPKRLLAVGAKPVLKPAHAIGDEEGKSPETGPPAGPNGPQEVDVAEVSRRANQRTRRTNPNQPGVEGHPTNLLHQVPRVGDRKPSMQERADERKAERAEKKG